MANKLYVKGYKPDTTLDQLVIYFQSKESSGGDIDDEQCKWEKDFAVIAFDDKEDLKRVLDKVHELCGSNLTISLQPFNTAPDPSKTRPKPKPRKPRNKSDKNLPQLPAVEKPIIGEIRTIIVSGICPETTNNTLQFFFENERRSGGGDIENLKRVEPQIAHITFSSSQVALSVSKREHLEVDGYLLKLEAQKPKVTFPTDKKKLYVENLSTKTSKDSLLNYIEVITGLEVTDLVFGKNDNATVTLNEEPDMNKTREKAKKKPLEGAVLKITNPPVCNSILVTGISEETKDSIVFKFENPKYGGGDILDIAYQQDQGKAVISYYDPEVINRMVSTEHQLNDSKLIVCRYYPFMESRDEHVVESKKKVITVKPDVMDHVSNRCDNEFLQSFGFPISQAKYDEGKEELTFIILPTGKPSESQIKEIENYFNKFVVKEIPVSRSLLTNSKKEVQELLSKTMESFNNKAHAAIDKEKLCILLTGKEDKLGKVTKALQKELDELHKKKEEAILNLSLDPDKLMLIFSLGFEEKFESELNIEVKIDSQNGVLILKGNKELVDSAKMEAYEMLSKVKEETIELNGRKEEFLESGGLEKINDGLRKRKMKALVCLDKSKPKRAKVELLNSQKFDEVDQYLSEQLSEKCLTIEKESVSLLQDEKWRSFRDALTEKFKIEVFIIGNAEIEVWLTGENKLVQKAYEELKEFVKLNTIISESIVLHHFGKYFEKYGDSKMKEITKTLKKDFVELRNSEKEGTLFLQGTKEGVKKVKIMLQKIIRDVAHRFIPVEEPGMQKYLQTESGRTSLEGLESKHQCTITLTNSTEQRQMEISPVVQPDRAIARGPPSRLLCSFETPEKMMLKVYQADITDYQCDVIVNAANGDLRHIGGVAKMIVDKGGKEIQEDCNEHIKKHGPLYPGECYSGIPGKLPCKRIIHTVGPRWDNVKRVRHRELLQTACEDSLTHAKTYSTIALPAVGSGVFGVPKDVCASVMVEAAENFSSESNGQYALQEIHFVNNDLTTAQYFVNEFKKRFSGKPTFVDKLTRVNRSRFNESQNRRRPQAEFEEMANEKASTMPTSRPSANNITTNTNTLISVVVGDLSTHQADVLVNTTSETLQLNNNPCSKALSNEAGPVLQQKCNEIGKIKVGEVAFTEGGNLLCKKVCHVVCTQYNNGQGEKVLRSIIKNALKQSDSLGFVSIAFPAIGTGVLAFPHQLTAKICFEETKEFGKKNPKSSVKDIRFVVYHQDQSSINAFKEELRKQPEWKKGASQGPSRRNKRKPVAESTPAPSSTERRQNSTEETSTTELPSSTEMPSSRQGPIMTEKSDGEISIFVRNGVTIQVLKGDITKETTDVIAHLSNPDMSMAGGVARAIIKCGGKEIERETQKNKPIAMYSVLLSEAGSLKAKYIAHMAAPDKPDSSDIGKCITNCLEEIAKKECKTISMPAIATGQLNMAADKSAKAMLTVIVAFFQTRPGSLNTVRIVIHDPEVFKKFSKAVKKLLQEEEESPGLFSTLISSFFGWFKSDSASSNTKKETAPPKSKWFLEIYADKDETIDKVAEKIGKITREQMKRESIEEDEIENLSEADISRIEKIGKEKNVEVKIQKSIKRIIVFGHSEDIGIVITKIRSILSEIKLAEQEKETAEMVSKGVQWYWVDTDGSQVEYDVSLNSKIEKAHLKEKKSVTFELEEGKCEIVFDEMRETNKVTGQKTEVVRKDLKAKAVIAIPDYWDRQPTDSKGKECPVHVVSLDPQNKPNHSKEYKRISDGFLLTAPNLTIRKIERIQNPSLFKLYALKKQSMDERDGSNEKFLYHGTATANVTDINKNGLNRSYFGKHGTAYGRGIYFARDAGLSSGYTTPDASGDRTMYVARVSVGQYTVGNSAMIVPPNNYDSVVDNITAPTIFVSFYDNQYYPEYLITYR